MKLEALPKGLERVGCAWVDEKPPEVHPSFLGLPVLRMTETESLPQVPTVGPTSFGPSTSGGGTSYYVFCVGVLIEIDLASGDVRRYEVPFDSGSPVLYSAGATSAYLAEDGRLYFALSGKPVRIGRFDPGTGEVAKLGELEGWAYGNWAEDHRGTIYVLGYPAMLGRVDMATGKVAQIGRLTPMGLYPWGSPMAADEEGFLYAAPGPRGFKLVAYDPWRDEVEVLHDGQAVIVPNRGRPYARIGEHVCEGGPHTRLFALAGGRAIAIDSPPVPGGWQESLATRLGLPYELEWVERAATSRVRFRHRGTEAWHEVAFEVPTSERILENLALGPDGLLYIWGAYCMATHDPRTGRSTYRPDLFGFSMYDSVSIGSRMYWGGYPSGRLTVYDTSRPVARPVDRARLRDPAAANPCDIRAYHRFEKDGSPLGVHRIWRMCLGADGRIYMGATASRWHRGGALIWFDPETGESDALREPFRFLGVSAIVAVEDGRRIAGVTWTSPDPLFPGQEPQEAVLFIFEVETKRIVHHGVPLPGCKVLTTVHPARPGKLVGLGMFDVIPLHEADDSYYGNTTLFFYDVAQARTTKRIDLPYSLCRRSGRPFVDAPDGSIWAVGGGALLRIDPSKETIEPLARLGPGAEAGDGNFLVLGDRIYLAGKAGLRIGELRGLGPGRSDPGE